ncbi:MAG: mraZ [Opitutaceae bacterium]|jgi:MraZ protein|nr:mraZ [Opitutaceae bacterium]
MSQATSIFYSGSHRHTLDDKNRLTIPSAWRSTHGPDDTFIATPHPGGYITVFSPDEAKKLYEKVNLTPVSDTEGQDALALFLADAQTFTFDKQGRFGLSDKLRSHAGIDKDTVMIGMAGRFNIYSPARCPRIAGDATGAAARAAQLDAMRRLGI